MSVQASSQAVDRGTLVGSAYAFGAFAFWGGAPLYFKAVSDVPAFEVLAHRVVWSVLCVALLILIVGQWQAVRRALSDRRTLGPLVLSALLISLNWLVFIWAVAQDRVLDASLGYYITPLISVLLGRLVLGERLWRVQWIAVALAAFGVGYMLVALGVLPWVSLLLGTTFGAYGLTRKLVNVGAMPGLFIETLLVAPLALAYLLMIGFGSGGTFGSEGIRMDVLLIAAGLITATPLILYAQGVRRLRLASIGLFQYIAPTGQMLLAVFVFGEQFTSTHFVTFACIWVALFLYSASAWIGRARAQPVLRDL